MGPPNDGKAQMEYFGLRCSQAYMRVIFSSRKDLSRARRYLNCPERMHCSTVIPDECEQSATRECSDDDSFEYGKDFLDRLEARIRPYST